MNLNCFVGSREYVYEVQHFHTYYVFQNYAGPDVLLHNTSCDEFDELLDLPGNVAPWEVRYPSVTHPDLPLRSDKFRNSDPTH